MLVRALNSPDLRERLQDLGADPVGNTPEQYTDVHAERNREVDQGDQGGGNQGRVTTDE